MKQYISILTALSILYSCNSPDNLPKELSVDNENLFLREIHEYEFYSNGQVNVERTINYHYDKGVLTDTSSSIRKVFFYNSKDKIERIVDTLDSTTQFKLYNNEDSLIMNCLIVHGDTIFLEEVDFLNGLEIKRSNRRLDKPKRPSYERNEYDTAIFTAEHTYDGNKIVKTISKYPYDSVPRETEHVYDGDKKIKTLKYDLIGGKQILKESAYYTYTNDLQQDFITLGMNGDTLQWTKHQNDLKIVNTNGKYGLEIEYFNKNNRLMNLQLIY